MENSKKWREKQIKKYKSLKEREIRNNGRCFSSPILLFTLNFICVERDENDGEIKEKTLINRYLVKGFVWSSDLSREIQAIIYGRGDEQKIEFWRSGGARKVIKNEFFLTTPPVDYGHYAAGGQLCKV